MAGGLRLNEQEAAAIIARINKVTGRVSAVPPAAVAAEIGASKRRALKRGPSELELVLAQQISLLELPAPVREYKAIPGRDFRLDFAWVDRRIGLEVQGMVHRIKGRFKNDIEKRALHLLHGWRVLEVSGAEVRSGRAAAWLVTLLEGA